MSFFLFMKTQSNKKIIMKIKTDLWIFGGMSFFLVKHEKFLCRKPLWECSTMLELLALHLKECLETLFEYSKPILHFQFHYIGGSINLNS